MLFSELGLSAPLQKAVEAQGYATPTPIQAQAIPFILQGRDIMAAAQTGTGKTAGFTLPLLQLLAKGEKAKANQVRALVLVPTRELAAQVNESVQTYGQFMKLSSLQVFGGVSINPQMQALRKGVDVLIATPGRLLDLFNQNAVKFDSLEILVLDEADRMLDMGFIADIRRLLKHLPAKRQTLLFSATFSGEIRELAQSFLRDPAQVSVTPSNSTSTRVSQTLYLVDKAHKPALLVDLVQSIEHTSVLVFTRTKYGADRLCKHLDKQGIKSAAIHGDKSQGARTRALSDFKAAQIRVLVATDIAARGIDIDELPLVINYELPQVAENYVHRIGRTGRAGASGEAWSLVCEEELDELIDIERFIGAHIPRATQSHSAVSFSVPETDLNAKHRAPKKPKKKPALADRDKRPAPLLGEMRKGRSGGSGGGNRPGQGRNASSAGRPSSPARRPSASKGR